MTRHNIPLGRIFGIPIGLDYSWFVIFALLTWMPAPAIHHVEVPDYPAAHSPYSHAVIANGLVFVSGQIPVRPGGGPTEVVGNTMQEQTRQSLRNVQTISKPPAARSTAW